MVEIVREKNNFQHLKEYSQSDSILKFKSNELVKQQKCKSSKFFSSNFRSAIIPHVKNKMI